MILRSRRRRVNRRLNQSSRSRLNPIDNGGARTIHRSFRRSRRPPRSRLMRVNTRARPAGGPRATEMTCGCGSSRLLMCHSAAPREDRTITMANKEDAPATSPQPTLSSQAPIAVRGFRQASPLWCQRIANLQSLPGPRKPAGHPGDGNGDHRSYMDDRRIDRRSDRRADETASGL